MTERRYASDCYGYSFYSFNGFSVIFDFNRVAQRRAFHRLQVIKCFSIKAEHQVRLIMIFCASRMSVGLMVSID